MSIRLCAAGLAAAAWLAGATSAPAADLYGNEAPPFRQSSPYDDPRYSDLYKQRGPVYAAPYGTAAPRPYVDPFRAPQFAEPPYRYYSYYGRACVPPHHVRARLLSQGWHVFTDLQLRGEVAFVQARHPNGRVYELQVERCTGFVIEARATDVIPDVYAWRHRPPYRAY